MDRFLNGILIGILEEKKALYNPTVFYGPLSSTMTVAAQLEHEYRLRFPQRRIVHTCGKEFFRLLVQSHTDGTLSEFRKPFFPADLLIFEDIEDIAGKKVAMQEFYGIFDRVYESCGQIVITALCPPHEIPALEDRVRTQLSGGMICFVENSFLDQSPEARARRAERTKQISSIGEKIAKELWPNEPDE